MAALAPAATVPRGALLGVERSFGGKRWHQRDCDERCALELAQRLGLDEVVARLLAARGLQAEGAEDFLAPSLRRLLPDPSHLLDMDRAAARLAAAIVAGEPVAVFGDYDVDGATSAAVLQRFCRALGRPLRVYIPDRIAEGYGPNTAALERLAREGIKVVVTVDCGITAYEPLEAAKAIGLDVIVVDHHAAEARLPAAYAVVNPNRLDESSPHRQLAAVGVTFLLVVALNRRLRSEGFYGAGRAEPNLLSLLDLVALGTVADVVPLTGLNRVFVAQGLKVLAAGGNVGLQALLRVSRLDRQVRASHLGFQLGPRVNAGGRVGASDLGVRLLACDGEHEALQLAGQLDQLNSERQRIEAQVLDLALEAVTRTGDPAALVLAAGEGWHPGVIGIVASRLRERFELPALVVALDGATGKGSARSVPGLDLGRLVLQAREAGLLINGGGHPMAAGLTVARGNLVELAAFLNHRVAERLAQIAWKPALALDAVLQPAAAKAALVRQVERMAPFGVGNPEPRYAFTDLRLAHLELVGETHLRLALEAPDGQRLSAIAFRAMDGPLGQALLARRGRGLYIAGRLELDLWRGGEAVQLVVEDAADAR
jgi:single-stranded-DNA-specific exonuclease